MLYMAVALAAITGPPETTSHEVRYSQTIVIDRSLGTVVGTVQTDLHETPYYEKYAADDHWTDEATRAVFVTNLKPKGQLLEGTHRLVLTATGNKTRATIEIVGRVKSDGWLVRSVAEKRMRRAIEFELGILGR